MGKICSLFIIPPGGTAQSPPEQLPTQVASLPHYSGLELAGNRQEVFPIIQEENSKTKPVRHILRQLLPSGVLQASFLH